MKPDMKKLLYSLVVLTVLFVVIPAQAETENIEKTFSVNKGGTMIIESDLGSINVETWNKGDVFVSIKKRASSQKRLDRFEVQIEQRGDDIYVEGDNKWLNRVRVEFHVNIPKEYNVDLRTGGGSIDVADINGNVKLHTSGGSISIGDVDGGDINAHTSGGSIKVGDVVNGKVKVDTSGGSISIGNVAGDDVDAHTSGGSIKVADVSGDLNVETSGGSIHLGKLTGISSIHTSGGSISLAQGGNNVKAHTSGGSISVEGSKGKININTSGGNLFVSSSEGPVKADTSGGNIKILQTKGAIDAETSGGSIEAQMIETDNSKDTHVNLLSSGGKRTVYLPATIKASVSARLKISYFADRDYQIYSDFPLSIVGEDSDLITAKGDINAGGDRIQLRTTNGDIYIKKMEK